MSLSPNDYVKLKELQEKWDNPEHEEEINLLDWRASVSKAIQTKDISALKQASIVGAQFGMIQLAHEAESETVKFQALQFLLSQTGHGPVSKFEHTVDYKRMPDAQLKSIIQSRLRTIKKFKPDFDLSSLLPAGESQENVPRETIEAQELTTLEAHFETPEE